MDILMGIFLCNLKLVMVFFECLIIFFWFVIIVNFCNENLIILVFCDVFLILWFIIIFLICGICCLFLYLNFFINFGIIFVL